MANIRFPFWQEVRKLLIDRQDGTFSERVEAYPPSKLLTDGDGDYARVRVDVAQTGFFAGREAFMFYDFTIPKTESRVIKVVAPVNTIVQRFSVDLILAAVRIELVVGGTESGSFSTPIAIQRTNSMTTASNYTPQVTMALGGTHTGGTVVDLLQAVSGVPSTQASAASSSEELPLGFPAGTYYIRIINSDGGDAKGIFRTRWEERP